MSKSLEDLIDEDYERLDQEVYEMEELGLSNYGDRSYYIRNRDEYEKDKTIADLEAKLAESEHRNEQLVDALNGEVFINYKLPMENAQLKQQLAEKETRIAELEDKDWYEGTIKQLEEQNERLIKQLAEKEEELKHKHWAIKSGVYIQDKISFAVEQLEKVKELCKKDMTICEDYFAIEKILNNKIEELKKEMK